MSNWRNKIPHEQVESDPTKQNIITGQLHRLIKLGVLMPEASQLSDNGIYVTIGLPSPIGTSKLQVGGTVAANEAEYDYELATLGQMKALAVPQLKTINGQSIIGAGDLLIGTPTLQEVFDREPLSTKAVVNTLFEIKTPEAPTASKITFTNSGGGFSNSYYNSFTDSEGMVFVDDFRGEFSLIDGRPSILFTRDGVNTVALRFREPEHSMDIYVPNPDIGASGNTIAMSVNGIFADSKGNIELGTVGGGITLGTQKNGLSLVGQELSLVLASSTTTGAISSSDWSLFAGKASTVSPVFTGIPIAPTASVGTNTTQVATTAFVLANSFPNIPHLEYSLVDKTVWNNGKGNVTTNTGFGDGASASNTSGYSWVSFGREAGYLNTTGHSWTAVGETACFSNTTGAYWTAIGRQAGYNSVGGSYWTALGESAGRYTSNSSSLTIINKSTFLGCNSRALVNNSDNEIVIGADAIGAGSNTATLGNTNITNTLLRGIVSGGSFVKNSAPSTNLLLAGGGDIAQNTFALTVSPTFTGVPVAPTPATGTNTSQIATTAFVANSISFATSTFVTTNTTQVIGASKTFGIDGQGHGFTFVVGLTTKTAYFTGDAFAFGHISANPGIGRKGNHVAVYSTGTMGFASLDTSLISSGLNNRVFTFPNQDGTFALTNNPTAISATQFNVSALNTAPASATASGTTGEIRVTSTHIYVCIATNTWVHSVLTTW